MRLSYRLRFLRDHRWAPAHMSEYLDEEIVAGGRQRMERHVAECSECGGLLAELRRLLGSLHGLPAPEGGVNAVAFAASVRGRLGERPPM